VAGARAGQNEAMDLVDPRIERYAVAHTAPLNPALESVADSTRDRTERPGMMSGLVEARLLQALVATSGATRVLEVGTFTGFGALALAEALPAGGTVTTLEADPANAAVARGHIADHPLGDRVELLEGDARELLTGLEGPFDLAYVDAWKTDYPVYLERVLPLLGPRGIAVFDNVLRRGAVLEPDDPVGAFNDRVQADPGLVNALLTIGDGVLLVWRAPEPRSTA
jgi:caffeoyl-CoA O-methyltransferase